MLPKFKFVEISLRHYLIVVLRSLFRRQREKLILSSEGERGIIRYILPIGQIFFLENSFEGDKT